MNKMMIDAAQKTGIKVHQGFMALGAYDSVWISEALDISGPMRMSTMEAESASPEALLAVSYEDAMKRMK